jgi:predicted nucleic acid-binding protein
LYRVSGAQAAKQRLADAWLTSLWAAQAGCVSWQVIFEFDSNVAGKFKVPAKRAREFVEGILIWQPAPPNQSMLELAWGWCDRSGVNFWDALIVASAEQLGCRWLLSEDFQAGQRLGGVTIVDPFTTTPAEFGLV